MRRIALVMIMLMSFAAAIFAEEKVWTKSSIPVYYDLLDYESSNAKDYMGYVSDYASESGLPISHVGKISRAQWDAIDAIMNNYSYASDEYYVFGFETQETGYIVEVRIDENKTVYAILYKVDIEELN